uniref:C2H2-type domain-containing protein n=1 Tax=Davidia involucrata TaxID=16924 RepID=A0A5B7APL4_DAVIN
MGFLIFAVKCLDVLAWPLLALGYPLCASIRAIETNSNSDMQKLITYWILFSLISLFELAFVQLIEWLPFWPYLKVIVTGWLVLPSFDGAYHVYDCLVRPLLSVNPQVVINHFNKPKDGLSFKTEDFLAMAERYVKENGSEALEKFVASKSNGEKPNSDVEVIKAVANREKKEVATSIQMDSRDTPVVAKGLNCREPIAQKHIKGVQLAEKNAATATIWCAEPNPEQADKRTVAAVEIKEMTAESSAHRENKLPEITTSKEVQKEWTCALCQMMMPSEASLNYHLQGMKHRAKCEELKAGEQTDENKSCFSSTTNKSNQTNREPKKHLPGNGPNKNGTKKQEDKVQVKGTSDQCKQKNVKNTNAVAGMWNSTLWCSICNIRCTRQLDMASHLSGRKHQLQIQEMFGSGNGWSYGSGNGWSFGSGNGWSSGSGNGWN